MIFLAFFSLPMWQNVFEEEKVEANEQKEGTTGLAVRRDGCGDYETEFEFEEAEALLVWEVFRRVRVEVDWMFVCV